MLSFRDGVQRLTRERLLHDLTERIHAGPSNRPALLGALLRAGELESHLEDVGHRCAALVRGLSDDLARAWLGDRAAPLAEWQSRLSQLPLPDELRLVRPEGYAYYGLDPAAYTRAVCARARPGAAVVLVGVRSIGTSLSALARASLAASGVPCERITVRPQGHPWQRELAATDELMQLVQRWPAASFLILDEGPGLSGSTFLAVGEALVRLGVTIERIELITSRCPDPERLLAQGAAARWQRFRSTSCAPAEPPTGARDLSAGAWREVVYGSAREWPACDVQLERYKYLEPSGRLLKFIGLPPYDERPLRHAELLAEAGFCPPVVRSEGGFSAQPWLQGQRLRLGAERAAPLQRLLEYLVFRSSACRAEPPSLAPLQEMLRVNVLEALGWELPAQLRLELQQPVFADGHLAAEEWIQAPDGVLLKVDAIDHGDDHQFPGPCDSAWDVAGAVIEWQLTAVEAAELCACYRRHTGDDVAARLDTYLLAYAALRVAQSRNAALSALPAERRRLARQQLFRLTSLRRCATRLGWRQPSCPSATPTACERTARVRC